jgi:soluble lytic murein transglycosylase-like protein
MSRKALTTLVSIAAIGLSCERPISGEASLPSVSAPPPSAAAEPEIPRPAAYAELTDSVAAHLRAQRRNTLSEAQIAAVARTIAEESQRRAIDSGLILAVIHVESRFDAYAVSPVGALGLMQILPSTGAELADRLGVAWLGPRSLFDPVVNVRLGIAYLDELAERYGNTAMALAAYNWGPGHIDQRLRLGTPMPTVYPGLVLEARSRQRIRRS